MNCFKRISTGIIVIVLLIIIGCSQNIKNEQDAQNHLMGWWIGFSKEVNMEMMVHFFQNEIDRLIYATYVKAEGDTSWGFQFAGTWNTLSMLDSVSNETSFGATLNLNNGTSSLMLLGLNKFAFPDSTYFSKSVAPKHTTILNNENDAKTNIVGWWQYINPETGSGVGYNFTRDKVINIYCDVYTLESNASEWVDIDMRGKCDVIEVVDENIGYKYYAANMYFEKTREAIKCGFYGPKNLVVSNQGGKLLYYLKKTAPPG